MSLEEDLRNIARSQRVYASLRAGGTKCQIELGVVTDLLGAMETQGSRRYHNPRSLSQDPPDCDAQTLGGEPVAIEVTEFVSQVAVEMNEAARPGPGQVPAMEQMVMAVWDQTSFISHLASALAGKDRKILHGGPYSEYVVVSYTDEPLLVRAHAEAWLSAHAFGPYQQITSAYFLFSYEGDHTYHFAELSLGGT